MRYITTIWSQVNRSGRGKTSWRYLCLIGVPPDADYPRISAPNSPPIRIWISFFHFR